MNTIEKIKDIGAIYATILSTSPSFYLFSTQIYILSHLWMGHWNFDWISLSNKKNEGIRDFFSWKKAPHTHTQPTTDIETKVYKLVNIAVPLFSKWIIKVGLGLEEWRIRRRGSREREREREREKMRRKTTQTEKKQKPGRRLFLGETSHPPKPPNK